MSKRQRTESEINDDYFKDYNNTNVHRLMLGDQARIRAYADAIQTNLHLFKNKIILDVGSGSGILALLAARAGAKKVYAVEASDMALTIRLTALENNLSDIVQVMHQKMEDVVFKSMSMEKLLSYSLEIVFLLWRGSRGWSAPGAPSPPLPTSLHHPLSAGSNSG